MKPVEVGDPRRGIGLGSRVKTKQARACAFPPTEFEHGGIAEWRERFAIETVRKADGAVGDQGSELHH